MQSMNIQKSSTNKEVGGTLLPKALNSQPRNEEQEEHLQSKPK